MVKGSGRGAEIVLSKHRSFFSPRTAGIVYQQRGLTLLELLIVIALLSIVALASTSLIIDTGEWKQQQLTEEQWLSTKRAILGDNVVDVHHYREYSGFVTDMGRLPNCMRELIRPFDCTEDLASANRLSDFRQDELSDQWAGWRGPYLGVPGVNEYRDGWRNQGRTDDTGNDDDVNYGWLFGTGAANGTACEDAVVDQRQPATLILQSCGDDGDVDNTETGFPGDFPYVEDDGSNITYIPLVTRHDYQVDLGESWLTAPVKVRSNNIGQSTIIPADSLRLRVNYPVENGYIPDWSDALLATDIERDKAPFLSETFPTVDIRLADGSGRVYTNTDADSDFLTDEPATAGTVTVPVGTTLSGTLMEVPNAVSSALVFSDSSELELQNCPCELVVETGASLSGTTVSNTVSIKIKPDNIAPIEANLAKYVIEVPSGTTVNSSTSLSLPNGAALTFSRDAEVDDYFPKIVWDVAGAQPTVTVSETFEMFGDLVETDTVGDQFLVPSTSIPVGNVITIEQAVPAIPLGLRNITILCEGGPAGREGLLYDGNCTDNNVSYEPIAVPYQLEISPRAYVPRPDEIFWNIKKP